LESPCLFVCGAHFLSRYLDVRLVHNYNHCDNLTGDEARQRNSRYRHKTNSFYHSHGRGFFAYALPQKMGISCNARVERSSLDKILIVGVGGFIGANVRYWLGAWIDAQFGLRFPRGRSSSI